VNEGFLSLYGAAERPARRIDATGVERVRQVVYRGGGWTLGQMDSWTDGQGGQDGKLGRA
jgi:hypothetical protein